MGSQDSSGKKREKKHKDKKRHKKDKKKLRDHLEVSQEQSQLTTVSISTAATFSSSRDSAKFRKEAKQMFQNMAATIDLSQCGALPQRYQPG